MSSTDEVSGSSLLADLFFVTGNFFLATCLDDKIDNTVSEKPRNNLAALLSKPEF